MPTVKSVATKISVLTPEMSQHAQIRNYGKFMGKGGVTFQPIDSTNVKRSFFTFQFDGEMGFSDDKEITEMEIVKEAVLERDNKSFRGRVVINIDGSDLNVIQKKLGYNLSHLTPLDRQAFLKQNKISIVGLLANGETEGEFPSFQPEITPSQTKRTFLRLRRVFQSNERSRQY